MLLAADVRADLIDVRHQGGDLEDRLLRNAEDRQPVPHRDVVDVGKGPRQRNLVAGCRPAARRDAKLLDVPVGIAARDGGHQILVSARPKLHVGGGIRTAKRDRSDERRRSGESGRIYAAVERHLQVGAFLCVERRLIGIARLRQQGQRHRGRYHRQQGRAEDDDGRQPPPA